MRLVAGRGGDERVVIVPDDDIGVRRGPGAVAHHRTRRQLTAGGRCDERDVQVRGGAAGRPLSLHDPARRRSGGCGVDQGPDHSAVQHPGHRREVVPAVQHQIDPIDLHVHRAETQMSGNRGTDDHVVDPVLRGSARWSGGCAHGPVLSGGGDATATEPTAGGVVPSITREVIDGQYA